MELTIGYVAGLIAFGIFVARQLSPNALAYTLSKVLGDVNTAATWTVTSSVLQQSYWPYLLRTDSAYNHGVRNSVIWVARSIPAISMLLSVASVVTPLGLYSELVAGKPVEVKFVYAVDNSPFGWGTMPREGYVESRTCGSNLLSGAFPCPFTNDSATMTFHPNGTTRWEAPGGLNVTVPQILRDTFSSGTRGKDKETVSNFFDIQFRQYTQTTQDFFNNGSSFMVGGYKNLQSLVLNSAIDTVEGLIVDTTLARIGFRRQTVPLGIAHGAEWQEDLLFVEPDTVCVDTNLTLDYTYERSSRTGITNVVLTDRGGFVNLNRTFPNQTFENSQRTLNLHGKAYLAAWLHNTITAMYFNVTNPQLGNPATPPLAYMNSAMNRTFRLDVRTSTGPLAVRDINIVSDYANIFSNEMDGYTNASTIGISSNVYNIRRENYTLAQEWCRGGNETTVYALSDQVLVTCGLMRSVPQRQNTGNSLTFESGSTWSQKLYSCASAVRASVKTVSLTYNGTEGQLAGLHVASIRDKEYADESSFPLWGVENTTGVRQFGISQIGLLWGLVDPEYENTSRLATFRQPSLYLPGMSDLAGITTMSSGEGIAAADFAAPLLMTPYCVGKDDGPDFDPGMSLHGCKGHNYQGSQSIAMFARWQNLSASANTASLIPNLIFTDVVANTLVGTKGRAMEDLASIGSAKVRVVPLVSVVRYHMAFAVPAIISAAVILFLLVSAGVTACSGKDGLAETRRQIQRLAPGRIYTLAAASSETCKGMELGSKEWSKQYGSMQINLASGSATGMQQAMCGASENREESIREIRRGSTSARASTERSQVQEADIELRNGRGGH